MQKLMAGPIVVLALLAALASPASAQKPPKVEASVTFPEVNPCTGEPQMVTLSWVITVHKNQNNSVATFKTTVETTDGFSGRGTETEVFTGDKRINSLNIRTTNGDQVAMVKGQRRIDLATGEVTNNFRSYCVRG